MLCLFCRFYVLEYNADIHFTRVEKLEHDVDDLAVEAITRRLVGPRDLVFAGPERGRLYLPKDGHLAVRHHSLHVRIDQLELAIAQLTSAFLTEWQLPNRLTFVRELRYIRHPVSEFSTKWRGTAEDSETLKRTIDRLADQVAHLQSVAKAYAATLDHILSSLVPRTRLKRSSETASVVDLPL